MKDYKELREECLNEIIALGIEPGNIIEWNINKRAKTKWGSCTKRDTGYVIQIAARLLEDERISIKACKETIIHEILHSCKNCMNHTGEWKEYAILMNNHYGYNIKRVTSGKEKGVENHVRKACPIKYVFMCKKCKQVVTRKQKCKFTKYYKNYGCGICGTSRAFIKV